MLLYWIPHYNSHKYVFCWLLLTSGIFECDLQGDQCHKSHWRSQPPDRELSHYDLIDYNDKNRQLRNQIILATDPCICCAVSTSNLSPLWHWILFLGAMQMWFIGTWTTVAIYRCDFGVKSCMKSISVPIPSYYMKPYTGQIKEYYPKIPISIETLQKFILSISEIRKPDVTAKY